MNVSRSSWHYRLYRYLHNVGRGPKYLWPFAKTRTDPGVPSSLCPYAWSILLALVGALFCAVLFTAASPLILIVWVVYRAGVGLVRYIDDAEAKMSRRRGRKEKEEKPPRTPRERRPSLVLAYLRAAKQRVCPSIKLVD